MFNFFFIMLKLSPGVQQFLEILYFTLYSEFFIELNSTVRLYTCMKYIIKHKYIETYIEIQVIKFRGFF